MQERMVVENAKRLRIMQLLLLNGADVHACQLPGTGDMRHEVCSAHVLILPERQSFLTMHACHKICRLCIKTSKV